MNVFEDLIEELRDENLIESTIFEAEKEKAVRSAFISSDNDAFNSGGVDLIATVDPDTDDGPSTDLKTDPAEFYRKEATEEVSSLQMVEDVLTGIEREYKSAASAGFNDLRAKKALHVFLQVAGEPASAEYGESDQRLRKEIEGWCTALADRDEKIGVADLRKFCENSRPVLSSQALISLARFYRNAPFSELVRSKFDYVMTRLFSREVGEEKRRLLFGRIEMVSHINTLYSRWSSLSVYSSEEYASGIREQTSRFSEFAAEAEAADSLEKLLNSDVFERMRQAKEDLADMFFASDITAAAIDCNLRIGNRLVDLVKAELERTLPKAIEEKYGDSYDQVVSDASGKTLQLAEILRAVPEREEPVRAKKKPTVVKVDFERAPVSDKTGSFAFLRVNKWLLAATILIAALSIGLYLWADQYETSQSITKTAAEFDLSGSGAERYITSAKKTTETVYGITMPEWELLDENEQKRVLQDALKFSSNHGIKRIQIANGKGRTVGFVSDAKVEIYQQ